MTTIPPQLAAAMGDAARVRTRPIDRAAWAADASHYLLTPRAVLIAHDTAEVAAILRAAGDAGSPVTFRAGGTSLSGQASTEGILVDVRRGFRRIDVLADGALVRAQPGATLRQVNARLAPYGRRLGPDPASEAACTIGGIVANNSSGMACGTVENAYATLASLVLVLPSGTIVDTGAADADAALAAAEPALVAALERLRRRVSSNPDSVARIRRRFAMKNTMGYGINAFLDFSSPAALLAHLVIGSEGTLAFVAEATFRTVAVRARAATGLAVFDDLAAATRALPELVATGAATLELMDASSLRVGQAAPRPPAELHGLAVTREAALLVEYRADEPAELAEAAARGTRALAGQPLRAGGALSEDPSARAAAWALRKGLYASVAGARPAGTTALLEDVVVPVPALADTCAGLQELFARHGYGDGVVFGHAKDGNIHFMLTDRFETEEQRSRLGEFTDDMADLILAADGNLKAEHGTGRAMAPYVRRQYGDELYEVMRALKAACDPRGILNPGVILEEDPAAALAGIQVPAAIEAEADRCVECGYCEPVCPSKDLTLTPRQRIVVRRAVARARAAGDDALVRALEADYSYEGVQTCAADGMCQTACPVLIDTGSLVTRLRTQERAPVRRAAWDAASRAWAPVTRAGALALSAAGRMPGTTAALTGLGRSVLGPETVPAWTSDLPAGGAPRRELRRTPSPARADAVFLPACVGSMFGPGEPGSAGVSRALLALAERAGVSLIVPDDIESLCCATPWSSKGIPRGRARMAERVAAAVADTGAVVPVISDATSCTEGFARLLADQGVATVVEDAVAFTDRVIRPRLTLTRPLGGTIALHPTCSSTQLGLNPALDRLARACGAEPVTPHAWGCCGFAGDRGMLHPELTAAATAAEAAEVAAIGADAHASCNRTCEIGMTRATGTPYRHVLELLEEATRPLSRR